MNASEQRERGADRDDRPPPRSCAGAAGDGAACGDGDRDSSAAATTASEVGTSVAIAVTGAAEQRAAPLEAEEVGPELIG